MKRNPGTFVGVAALLLSVQAMAQITFYEGEGFRGRAFTTSRAQSNFMRTGFNDRASSVVVDRGTWQVCDDADFRGRCVLLRPGAYDSLRRLGVNDRLSSVRQINNRRRSGYDSPEPMPFADYDYRRRPNERVYEAYVTSVHAVVGPPDRRCWVEREQVEGRGPRNVAGGVVGAVIGGIIGHQIGYGRGSDVGTVAGAAVGAAIGSNQGRGDVRTTEVRRCETAVATDPDYWDVTYRFRDVDHHVQMTSPPDRVIYVNRDGFPRQ